MRNLSWLLLSSTALFSAATAFADGISLPTNGQFAAGKGAISQAGATLTVSQASTRGVINWQDFSIGQGGKVQFNNGTGATLNRVTGGQQSLINGTLTATGSLYLINPQGVVIGSQGVVTTGGDFVVSTHNLTDDAFMAGGSFLFKSESTGTITNLGQVSSTGGDVVLIAREVTNTGSIKAPKGTAALAGGNEVLLAEPGANGGERVFVRAGNGKIDNKGKIEAAQAELKAAGGNIYALAGDNGGIVRATGTETREGRVWLTANSGDITNSGTLAAGNADGSGGRVDVQAPSGTIIHSGSIDVRGTAAGKAGGTAVVTGVQVGLTGGSTIDASGKGKGGQVLVGGDWQGGKEPTKAILPQPIPAAKRVTMTAGASIKAEGGQGDGGKVVLWSEDATRFAGSIGVRGARNGGAVETSSKGTLDVTGQVDAAGLTGKAGEWLLDPRNVTITTSTSDGALNTGVTPNLFTPTGDNSTIDVATITSALNAGTSVTIQTAGSGAQAGDITVASAIAKTAGGDATLTLQADGSINVNQSITSSAGKFDLSLISGSAIVFGGSGAITVSGNVTLTATGNLTLGSIIAGNGSNTPSTITLSTGGAATQTGGLDTNNLLLAGTGSYTLTHSNNNVRTAIAADHTGTIVFSQTGELKTGTVGAVSGITSSGAVTLSSVGNITLGGQITTGALNTLTLATSFYVDQTAAITTANLLLLNTGSFTLGRNQFNLTASGNAIGRVAAGTTGNANPYGVAVTTTGDLSVGMVGSTDGIASRTNVTLTAAGNLSLDRPVIIGTASDNYLILSTGGTTTQNVALSVANLLLTGTGTHRLTNTQNQIGTLAASTGSIEIGAKDALAIGLVFTDGPLGNGLALSGSGTLTVAGQGGMLSVSRAIALSSTTGTLTLIADRMSINANVTQNKATVQPYSTGWGIDLGSTTDSAASALELSNNEYQRFRSLNTSTTGTDIQIGGMAAGSITVSQGITQDISGYTGTNSRLTLTTGSNITFNNDLMQFNGTYDLWLQASGTVTQAGGHLQVNGLLLGDTTGSGTHPQVTLTSTTNRIGTVAGWANSLNLTTQSDLTVGTVRGVDGLTVTENLFITVAAQNGKLTIDKPLLRTSSASTFALTMDRLTVNDQVDQGQTNATMAKIAPFTTGRGINLGGTNDASGALEISAAEYAKLGLVTGDGGATGRNLQIGNANTGDITITDVMVNNSANLDSNNDPYRSSTSLVSGAGITETGNGAITALYLTAVANGAISLNGANDVFYLSNVFSNNHNISFRDVLPGSTLSIYNAANRWFSLANAPSGGIDAGTGTITLTFDTPVGSQSAMQLYGKLVASGLELIGPRTVFFLYDNDIHFDTVAGHVGQLALYNERNTVIGQVGNTTGITSEGFINHPDRGVAIESAGTITQTEAINVTNLYFGQGTYTLNNAGNHATYLGGYSYRNILNGATTALTAGIDYTDSGDFSVKTTSYYPIFAAGSVTLRGNDITISQDNTGTPYVDSSNQGTSGSFGYGIVAGGSVTLIANRNLVVGNKIVSGSQTDLQTAVDLINKAGGLPANPGPFAPSNITYGGNITLTANATGNGGTIGIFSTSLKSNGGNIALSGGTNPATGYAVGDQSNDGIRLQAATLDAGAGDVVLRGKGVNGISLINASQILTTSGTITLTGLGMGVTAAAQTNDANIASAGILLSSDPTSHVASLIQSMTGAITLTGSGDTTVATNRNFGISFWGGSVQSSGGSIDLTGHAGGTAATSGNDGIAIDGPSDAASILLSQGANAGTITLTGTGRGGVLYSIVNTNNVDTLTPGSAVTTNGVRTSGGAVIQSAKGTITITGTTEAQGQMRGNTNGVSLKTTTMRNTGGAIVITGSAAVSADNALGSNGYTANSNYGIYFDAVTLDATGGSITLTGTGGGLGSNRLPWHAGTGFKNSGVAVTGNSALTTNRTLTLTGTGGQGSNPWGEDGQEGVIVESSSVLRATGGVGSNIVFLGYGGGTTDASFGHGVQLNGGAQVLADGGNISLTGYGHGQFSSGVILRGGSLVRTSGTGTVTLYGETYSGTAAPSLPGGQVVNPTADPVYYGSSSDTIAVRLSGGTLQTENGAVTVTGLNTSNDTNSPGNYGSNLGINSLTGFVIRTTGSGNIALSGTGGTGGQSTTNYGINYYGQILAEGTGNITLTGTAGSTVNDSVTFPANIDWSGYSNFGVYLGSNSAFGGAGGAVSRLRTASGSISITGINADTHSVSFVAGDANTTAQGNLAVFIDRESDIQAGGAGAITIEGQGANGAVALITPVVAGGTYNGIATSNGAITVRSSTNVVIGGNVAAGSGKDLTVLAGSTTTAGNITLSGLANLGVTGAGNIVLAAKGGNFANTSTASNGVLSVGTGRWLVYSSNQSNNSGEMAGYQWRRYNATYDNLAPANVTYTGSGFIYTVAPTVDVAVTGTDDKTYDATTTATAANGLNTSVSNGVIHSDTLTITMANGATGTFANANAGTGKAVTYATSLVSGISAKDTNNKAVYGYSVRQVTGTANIDKATLTVAANARSKTYGDADPTLDFAVSGLKLGDATANVLSGGLTRTGGENVGTYDIGAGTLTSNANYRLVFHQGTLTISAAPLIITANSAARLAGQANPPLGVTYAGFVRGDTNSVVSGLGITTPATIGSAAGSYSIVPFGGSAANYSIRYVNGQLVVTEASSSVIVVPALGGTATGGTSSATGFQVQATTGSPNAVSSNTFVAPAATFSTPVSAGTTVPSGSSATIVATGSAGGIVSLQTAPGTTAGSGASSGGQMEASISAGSFNVIYSQPANYQVSGNSGASGSASSASSGATGGSTGTGVLAASSSFVTFSGNDHPSVAVVNNGTSGTSGDDAKGSSKDEQR
jgi:filamentous hemagglutinin family protein